MILYALIYQTMLIGMQQRFVPIAQTTTRLLAKPRFIKNATKFLEAVQTGAKEVEMGVPVLSKQKPFSQKVQNLTVRMKPEKEEAEIIEEEKIPIQQLQQPLEQQQYINQIIELSKTKPQEALARLHALNPAIVMNMYTMYLSQQIGAYAKRAQQQSLLVKQLKQEKSQLTREVKTLKEETQKRIDQAIKQARLDVEQEKQHARTELQRLKQETESTVKKIEEAAQQEIIKREQLIRTELGQELDSKIKELQQVRQEIKRAQDAERYAKKQAEEKTNELEEIKRKLEETQSLAQEAHVKAQKAESDLVEYKQQSDLALIKEQQEKEAALQQALEANKNLLLIQSQMAESKQLAEQQKQQLARYEEEVKKIQPLQERLQSIEQANQELAKTNEKLQMDLLGTSGEILKAQTMGREEGIVSTTEKYKPVIEKLEQDTQDLRSQNEKYLETITSLQKEKLPELQNQVETAEQNLRMQITKNEKLQKDLDELRKSLVDANNQRDTVTQKFVTLEQETIPQLHQEIDRLAQENVDLKNTQIPELYRQIEQLTQTNKDLNQNTIPELKQQIALLTEENKKIASLESANQQLQHQVATLQGEANKVSDLEQQVSELSNQNTSLQNQLTEAGPKAVEQFKNTQLPGLLAQEQNRALQEFQQQELPSLLANARQQSKEEFLVSEEYQKLIAQAKDSAVENYKQVELANLLQQAKQQGEEVATQKYNRDLKRLEDQIPSLQEEAVTKYKNGKEFQTLLISAKQEGVDSVQGILDVLRNENQQLKQDVQDLNKQANLVPGLRDNIRNLEQQIAGIPQQKQQAVEAFKNSNEYQDVLQKASQVDALQHRITQLEQQLQKSQQDVQAALQNARAQFEIGKAQGKADAENTFNTELQRLRAEKDAKIAQLNNQIRTLTNQNTALQEQLTNVQNAMQQQIDGLKEQINNLTTTNSDLMVKNQKLTKDITNQQREAMENYKRLNDVLLASDAELKNVADNYNKRTNQLQRTEKALERKNTELVEVKNQVQKMNNELVAMKRDVATRNSQIKRLKDDVERLLRDIENKRYDNFRRNFRDFARKWQIRPEGKIPHIDFPKPPQMSPITFEPRELPIPEPMPKPTPSYEEPSEPTEPTPRPTPEQEEFILGPQPGIIPKGGAPKELIETPPAQKGQGGDQKPPHAVQPPGERPPFVEAETPSIPQQVVPEAGRAPGIYGPSTTGIPEGYFPEPDISRFGELPYQPYPEFIEPLPEIPGIETGLFEGVPFGEPLTVDRSIERPIERMAPVRPVELGKDVPAILDEAKVGVVGVDKKMPGIVPAVVRGYERAYK